MANRLGEDCKDQYRCSIILTVRAADARELGAGV